MIYLDNAATSFPKPEPVYQALDAFALFTGRETPASAMERAFDWAVAPLAA